jgi:hypothetical protein
MILYKFVDCSLEQHVRLTFNLLRITGVTILGEQNYWVFGPFHGPVFYKIENTTFRKEIQFPKRRVFYFVEYRTMVKVEKSSNSVCYTPSSEPVRIYY